MSDLPFITSFNVATVDGVTTASCAAFDGVIECVPREQLAAHVARHHADRIGTYLSAHMGSLTEQPFAYIGSGHVASRLTRHLGDAAKGPFTHAIIIYSPSGFLTGARAGVLEAALHRAICGVGQARVLNHVNPAEPRLESAADVAVMHFYAAVVTAALKLIGFGVLIERLPRVHAALPCACTQVEEVFRLAAAYKAHLVARGDRLFIRAGSRGRAVEGERWAAERGTGYTRRRELIDAGLLLPLGDGEHLIATADIPVRSPSEASCVLSTQENSGRTAWRHVETGRPFAEVFEGQEEGWVRDA